MVVQKGVHKQTQNHQECEEHASTHEEAFGIKKNFEKNKTGVPTRQRYGQPLRRSTTVGRLKGKSREFLSISVT